jgi:tRNA1Val (adenine37-N6)-methyltransferase
VIAPEPPALRVPHAAGPGETLDAVEEVRILQPRDGYRLSVDPLLLARFACPHPGALEGQVIDLGTGCGVIPLLLASRQVPSVGLELQPRLADLARRNVRLNGRSGEVRIVRGDLRRADALFPAAAFRHVLCNPPFHRRPAGGHLSACPEKAIARHELTCTLEQVLGAAGHLLEPLGSLWLILPASRAAELLAGLARARLTPTALRFVHPRLDAPARRVLVRAVKHGKRVLEVLPPWAIARRRLQPPAQAL